MSGIFISYRRKDTAAYAGWLFDTLRAHFGEDQLFRDIDNIGLGDRFPEIIEEAIASCDVVIALIGDKWLTVTDEHQRPRLQNANDHVRRELEAALRREDVLLIPVLLDGTLMPAAASLPKSIRGLAERNALSLESADWDADVSRLMKAVERRVPRREEAPTQPIPAPAEVPATDPEPTGPIAAPAPFVETPERGRLGGSAARAGAIAAGAVVLAVTIAAVLSTGAGSTPSQDGTTSTTVATSTTTTPPPDTTIRIPPPTTVPTPRPTTATTVRPAPTTTVRPATTTSSTSTSTSTTLRYGPDTCKSGFVWREARATDHVCVTPDTRSEVLADNRAAPSRWVNGPYGPQTCVVGYVWREAFTGDTVCVTPRTREQALYDNSQASYRLARAG